MRPLRCAQIGSDAAGLCALPEADPERQAAFEHAAWCAACKTALAEGDAVLQLLSAYGAPASPRPAALERACGPVLAALEEESAQRRRRVIAWLLAASALIGAFVLALLAGGTGPLGAGLGARCLRFELIVAVAPLAIAAWAARRRLPGAAVPAATAGLAALAGQAFLQFECPMAGSHPHLLVFHAGGVLVALIMGAVTGRVLAGHTAVAP
jgi:hypothetical protein